MKKKPPTTGQRIHAARKGAGLSQRELCELSGVAQNGICEAENDQRELDNANIKRLAAVLGCEWKDLLAD